MTSTNQTTSHTNPSGPNDPSQPSITSITRKYYDSPQTDEFYHTIWGGSNISIGIYLSPNDPIAEASQRTVSHMAALAAPITPSTRVIDLGAGYGGSARYLARTYGCHVTCLNLSPVQNERNRRKCSEHDLEDLVHVVEGSFEDVPVPDGSFDLVWSQDAFLHSAHREKILDEIDRVLVKKGGKVVFSDLLEKEDVDRSTLKVVLNRLPVDHFGTARFYLEEMKRRGFVDGTFEDLGDQLATHYERLIEDVERFQEAVSRGEQVTKEFSANTKGGLSAGAKAARDGNLSWGCFSFQR